MAFEKARGLLTRIQQPLVNRMGGIDPAVLTWISVIFAGLCCWLLATSSRDENGALQLVGALVMLCIAAELDALDGAVARTHGKVSKYGDWLDHTIDRLVDLGLLISIGLNAEWIGLGWLGWAAATMTLLGSYMGTQAQSVGLGRNYGGFSRADRLLTTFIGTLVAAIQAYWGKGDLAIPNSISNLTGIDSLNGLSAILIISLIGGIWTFLTRAISSRKALLLEGE
ncbi:MAG: CDP-alcohol phosphatidyltransferase family protein [Candidatus Thalassarchaeaceae archaeon]|jgi:phosphatidylglycerophosphate synthase|nr:CDP-alcohol phosphatidyltransferase family protein [Candidatus Thalassarchaeaceae archaeon]